jgi:hypothetical protein
MIGFFISGAIFWLAVVWVSQDHHINWLDFLLFFALAHFASWGIAMLASMALGDEMMFISRLVQLIAYVAMLVGVLYFRLGYDTPVLIGKILGLFFLLTFLFDLIVGYFIKINSSILMRFWTGVS